MRASHPKHNYPSSKMISCRELLFPVWCVFHRYNYSSKSTSQAPAFPNLKPHTPPCWISQSSHEAQKVWAIIPSLRACVHLLHLMLDEKHLDQLSQPASVCHVCVRFTVYRPSCVLQCMCLCVYVSWLDSCVFRNLGSAHIPEAHMIWRYVYLPLHPLVFAVDVQAELK